MFKEVTRLPEFEKDIRKLLKRFRTLEDDLHIFLRIALIDYHKNGIPMDRDGGIVPIQGLGFEKPKVYKARKFACKSLKGKGVQSGMRVIYAYFEEGDKLARHLSGRIELIEMYYSDKESLRDKGDKENEDRRKIEKHYAKRVR